MPPKSTPKLRVPRHQALRDLEEQTEFGAQLMKRRVSSETSLVKLADEIEEWSEENLRLLATSLSSDAYAYEYNESIRRPRINRNRDPRDEVTRFREALDDQLVALDSICKRIELLEEENPARTGKKRPAVAQRVFIVHGHDDAARLQVETTLHKLGFDPVVLSEATSGGKTIIEKFESHSADVGYAIVILTPDDEANSRRQPETRSFRARQNVVFELGYFVAKLGRSHVCTLSKEGVEIPTDLHGVVYVPMDEHGHWKLRIAKEMKQAGLPVDLNKL